MNLFFNFPSLEEIKSVKLNKNYQYLGIIESLLKLKHKGHSYHEIIKLLSNDEDLSPIMLGVNKVDLTRLIQAWESGMFKSNLVVLRGDLKEPYSEINYCLLGDDLVINKADLIDQSHVIREIDYKKTDIKFWGLISAINKIPFTPLQYHIPYYAPIDEASFIPGLDDFLKAATELYYSLEGWNFKINNHLGLAKFSSQFYTATIKKLELVLCSN